MLHGHQHSRSLHVVQELPLLNGQLTVPASPTCGSFHVLPRLSTSHVVRGRQRLECRSLLQVLATLLPLLHV